MNNSKFGRMAAIALLMGLIVVMQLLSGMIPPVGGFTISLVLIPIVLGGALFGPRTGAFLGGVFGIIVMIGCITGTDVVGAMVFQVNPILCFLVVMSKGILAGFLSGLVYKFLRGKNSYFAMLAAAVVCPTVNTGVFVACMLTFFKDVLAVWAGGGDILAYVLTGLVLANYIPELLINVVFSPAGQRILHTVQKK